MQERFAPEAWRRAASYRHGLALFCAGYFWESHEVFEGLWRAFGRATPEGRLLQALILAAGAALKHELGVEAGARRLAARGRGVLEGLPACVLGVDVDRLALGLTEMAAGRAAVRRVPLAAPRRPR